MLRKALDLSTARDESADVTLGFSCDQLTIRVQVTQELLQRNDALNMKIQGFDLTGGALNSSAYVITDLILGLDLTDKQNPRPYVDEASNVAVTLRVWAPDINSSVSIGSLPVVSVQHGRAALDRDGLGLPGHTDSTEPARYTYRLKDTAGDRYYFDQPLGLGQVQTSYEGKAEVQLPLYFPTPGIPMGGSAEDGDDEDPYPENQFVYAVSDLGNPANGQVLESPDVGAQMDVEKLLEGLATGLSNLFDKIAAELKSKLLAQNLPLIGPELANVVTFVQDIENQLFAEIDGRRP